MSETIKPGKYITRQGYTAVILAVDAPGKLPIVGYMIDPDDEWVTPSGWWEGGKGSPNGEQESSDDLVGMVVPI
jgi:hypothetical protein